MKTYFYVVGILSALVLVQSETDNEPKWKTHLEECRKEYELSEESLKSPDFDDSKTRCLSACFLKKGDRLIEGKVSLDKEVELALIYKPDKFEIDAIKEMTTECVNKANEEKDECAVAGTLFKCWFEKFGPPSA